MSEMVAKVAKAILEAATEDGGGFSYVRDDGEGRATLDGHFDLNSLARAAIEAMMEPTPDVEIAIDLHCNFKPWEGDGKRAWQAGIESALGEKQ